MAQKIKLQELRDKNRVSRKGRHSKRVKARDKKQMLFTQGACRG
jgi:hypothetical protein|tara:strand:+ start:2328 stop:2459 length:132 start_codon:yes stop_codon:yes gene_type:complete